MTDREQRDAKLKAAAKMVEDALPKHHGAARFNLFNGKVANVNIEESVQLQKGEAQ